VSQKLIILLSLVAVVEQIQAVVVLVGLEQVQDSQL
jgi:hypothetical protein